MGIGGSFLDANKMQKYFGIRAEWVDMSEILRRIDLEIYDKAEYEKELAWIKANCKEGKDNNGGIWGQKDFTREELDKQWEFVAKMTLIIKDIMLGNDKLNEIGRHEEALGRNAILAGFQGQRMWTDYKPNGDYTEAILNSTFDWNGKKQPLLLATESDNCNGLAMLFENLLTGQASAFADVRTYWSPKAVERVAGWKPTGKAKNGFMHLINSGAAALDATGVCKDKDGNPVMKKWTDVTDKDIAAMMKATEFSPANRGYFRGGGFSSTFSTAAEMPVTLVRVNNVEGIGYTIQIAEGWTVVLPEMDGGAAGKGEQNAARPHRPDLAFDLVRASSERNERVLERVQRDGELGRKPRRVHLRAHRQRFNHAGEHVPHSGNAAQHRGQGHLAPARMERVRHEGSGGSGLPRLRQL